MQLGKVCSSSHACWVILEPWTCGLVWLLSHEQKPRHIPLFDFLERPYFFKSPLLTYKLHTTHRTHVKYTVWWILAVVAASYPESRYREFSPPQRDLSWPCGVDRHPHPSDLSASVIFVASTIHMQSLIPGLYHLQKCFWGALMFREHIFGRALFLQKSIPSR